ncbi:hypothetical protein HQ529_02455 [Candidatus Woesearchaeota archaeon]|nr:hypothetical protein [Candidatus Woesearchaeota archaeon]
MKDEISKKALKVSIISSIIFFLFFCLIFWVELEEIFSNFSDLDIISIADLGVSLIIGIIIIGLISFFISKSVIKSGVEFRGLQWFFLFFGVITGFGNLLFWLIMYGISMGDKEYFFSIKSFTGEFIFGE